MSNAVLHAPAPLEQEHSFFQFVCQLLMQLENVMPEPNGWYPMQTRPKPCGHDGGQCLYLPEYEVGHVLLIIYTLLSKY